MAKAIMMCGRICSGKSTYAESLRVRLGAVVLSVDEILLALFDGDAGERHDEYVERLKKYLYEKSLEILETGVDVILDSGLWTSRERLQARAFYDSHDIVSEVHYIDISSEEWERRLAKRNRAVTEKRVKAYYVDEGLAEKFGSIFEVPEESEIDVWVRE